MSPIQKELDKISAQGEKLKPITLKDDSIYGSGWYFVASKEGNFWRHRSGLVLMASSNWGKSEAT
jgi:hypothetical protein